MLTDRERLILLNLVPGVGSLHLRRLLDAFGDVAQVCAASVDELRQVEGIAPRMAQRLADGCRDERRLEQELALAKRHGAAIVTLEDAGYPKPLRDIPDPPLALYVRGTLAAEEAAVALVGTRRASLYGLECAQRLGYELALRGIAVVSGLARGIDAAAHQGALKAPGRTIAVLGSGLSRLYPEEHEPLAAQIAEQGAVISEYPMDTQPLGYNFPRRNRIISGLSMGVVVVEAAGRSGALITADAALEQGREVFAVPGPMRAVTSHGTHQLLKQGARLVTSVEDILEELGLPSNTFVAEGSRLEARQHLSSLEPPALSQGGVGMRVELSDLERRVFACVSGLEPADIDAIALHSGVAMPEASSSLLQLELKRLVRRLPGKQFIRKGR